MVSEARANALAAEALEEKTTVIKVTYQTDPDTQMVNAISHFKDGHTEIKPTGQYAQPKEADKPTEKEIERKRMEEYVKQMQQESQWIPNYAELYEARLRGGQ